MRFLLILLFIPTILYSQDKVKLIDYSIDMAISTDTIFVNTFIKGYFRENLFLLNSLANIRDFKINGKDAKFTLNNDTLRCNDNGRLNTMRIEYFFIKDKLSFDSVIALRNENSWFPRISNSVFNYNLNIEYNNEKYFLISAFNNNSYSAFNKSDISVFFLPKETYKIHKFRNNKIDYNYYSLKEIKIDSLFLNEFIYSSNYFIDFFNKRTFNTLNIIYISSDIFDRGQCLNQSILIGNNLYNEYFKHPKTSWISHEVCHLWWGKSLLINNKSINYRFMEESITEYLKYTYIKSKYGSEFFDYVLNNSKIYCNYYINDTNVVSVSSVKRFDNTVNAVTIYNKGPLCINEMNKYCDINSLIKGIFKEYNNTMIEFGDFEKSIKSFDKSCLLQLNDLLYSEKYVEYTIYTN